METKVLVTGSLRDADFLMLEFELNMVVVMNFGDPETSVLKRNDYHPPESLREINRNFGNKEREYGEYSLYVISMGCKAILDELNGSQDLNSLFIP